VKGILQFPCVICISVQLFYVNFIVIIMEENRDAPIIGR